MSDKEKKQAEKQNKDQSEEDKTELNKELRQTFPASDPPSRTRPGHEKDKDDEGDQ